MNVLTIVTADIDEAESDGLIQAYRELLALGLPDGLLETQLLGNGQGGWAIHSLWRDRQALADMRAQPDPPAAPALFKRFGGEPELAILHVQVDSRSAS